MKITKPGVYMILNIYTNDRYIGSTPRPINRRWAEHRYSLRNGRHGTPALQSAWNQFEERAFRLVILENITENIREREQYWLDKFRSDNIRLYNSCPSAFDNTGLKRNREFVAKRAKKLSDTRNNWSPQRKQEYSDLMREIYSKPEMKTKISQSVKEGKRIKNEARDPARLISPDGTIVEVFQKYNFCLEHNLNPSAITKVIQGKRPSHKGWRKA